MIKYNKNALSKKRKLKMNRIKKASIALTLSSFVIIGSFFGFISRNEHEYNNSTSNDSYSVDEAYAISSNNHIDIDYYDEFEPGIYNGNYSFNIDDYDYNKIINHIEKINTNYSYSNYYDINTCLEKYNEETLRKNSNEELITNGKIDCNKLIKSVYNNNKEYLNSENKNYFYKETSENNINKICNMITDIINSNIEDYDIEKLSYTLSKLRIFQKDESTAFAYVTSDLILVYNPKGIDSYKMIDPNKDKYDMNMEDKILTHEIMHILQYLSSDLKEDNGIEAGFCRKYDDVNVNSLWISWLLEGSAEKSMMDYYNTTASNYKNTISYISTYDLSRIFDSNYNVGDLENASFTGDLDSCFKMLNIKTKKDKLDFLNLVYSIELTQNDCDDFWAYYEKKTGYILDADSKLEIKKEIRMNVINNLSCTYFKGLLNSVKKGNIKDLNTLFYFLRLWEIDSCNHIQATTTDYVDISSDYMKWEYNLQTMIFEAISNSINLSYEEIEKLYDDYSIKVMKDNKIENNYDSSIFTDEEKKLLEYIENNISVTYFSRVKILNNYYNKQKSY